MTTPREPRWSFARGAVAPIFSVGGTIFSQLAQVGFVLFPGDVSGMGIADEKRPLLLGDQCGRKRPIRTFAGMRAPIAESAGIAGIAQDLAGRVVDQRRPMALPFMGSGANMARKEQPLGAKEPHRPPGRSNAFERREQETKSLLDLGESRQDHRAILSVGQANRQRHLQGATLRLVENPTSQARLEHMELGLRHRALHYVSSKVKPPLTLLQTSTVETPA